MKTDPRVDSYIAKAQPFAQPILHEARKRIQTVLPGAEEAIKWNVPFFLLAGKIVASMAAFKKHVKIGVWVGKRPTFQDLADVADLTATKDFAEQLRAAAEQSGDGINSGPVEPNVNASAKSAKKVPAKSAKKTPKSAKKAPTKSAKKASSKSAKTPPARATKQAAAKQK